MTSILLPWLLRTSVVLTALLCLILLVRPILRRYFGARVAYASWLLLLAGLMPPLTIPWPIKIEGMSQAAALPALATETYIVTPGLANGIDLAMTLVSLWLTGALLMLLVFWRRQWRFVSALQVDRGNVADDRARLYSLGLPEWIPVRSSSAIASPLVVGCLPPRLMLPPGSRQPEVVLAHEIAHVRHGDPIWSWLFTTLRGVFWFLPWLHMSWKAFRLDQELAADEAVLNRLDRPRRYHYASLLVQSAGIDQPVTGQAWFDHSQLKERIRMINNISHSGATLKSGLVLVTGLLLASTWVLAVAPTKATGTQMEPVDSPAEPEQQNDRESEPATGTEIDREVAAEMVPDFERLRNSEPLTADQVQPIVRVNPLYPRQAAMDGTTGHVAMEAVVTRHGDVTAISIVEAEPEGVFDTVAVEAFSHWKFAPIISEQTGQPESRKVQQVIEFVLD